MSGYLDAVVVTTFDHVAFGLSSAEASIADPQQRLCLRTALEALEDGAVTKVKGAAMGIWAQNSGFGPFERCFSKVFTGFQKVSGHAGPQKRPFMLSRRLCRGHHR